MVSLNSSYMGVAGLLVPPLAAVWPCSEPPVAKGLKTQIFGLQGPNTILLMVFGP